MNNLNKKKKVSGYKFTFSKTKGAKDKKSKAKASKTNGWKVKGSKYKTVKYNSRKVKESKNEEIVRLEEQWDREYKEYKISAAQLNKEIEKQIRNYNSEISIINSLKFNEFTDQLNKMHEFLKVIGSVDNEINMDDFVIEDMKSNFDNEISEQGTLDLSKFERFDVLDLLAFIEPTVRFIKYNKMKKELKKELIVGYRKDILKYKADLEHRKSVKRSLGNWVEIAQIYRNNIYCISKTIREKILPEMVLVRSFLIAENIKNKIVSDEFISDVKPESISLFKNTPYHRHYQYVKNVMMLYKLIVEFYTKPILTNLSEKSTQKENVMDSIGEIDKCLIKINESSVLCGEDKNESR